MSNKSADVKVGHPIGTIKRSVNTTASGEFDALGCNDVLVYVARGVNNVKSKQILRIRHSSATGTDYASATAMGTAVIGSSTASGSTSAILGPFRIDMSGKGRYLNFLLSNTIQSAFAGVIVNGMTNEKIAPSSTGFTAVTGVATAPNNP